MHRWTGSAFGTGKGLWPVRCQDITWTIADLLSIAPLGTNFSEISIRIKSFSFKNMRLKFSQRNFPSGDLLTYSTSRPIWYVRYVMRAKCWWPYLGHRTNSQCNRVWHFAPLCGQPLAVLFIHSHPLQPRGANQHDWDFPFVNDRIDRMCSLRILSADTTQRPWALLFLTVPL